MWSSGIDRSSKIQGLAGRELEVCVLRQAMRLIRGTRCSLWLQTPFLVLLVTVVLGDVDCRFGGLRVVVWNRS